MRSLNRRYGKISSLEELRLEREKLALRMEIKQLELQNDVDYLRSLFSVDVLVGAIFGRDSLSVIWDGVRSGVSSVVSMFRGNKGEKPCGGSD